MKLHVVNNEKFEEIRNYMILQVFSREKNIILKNWMRCYVIDDTMHVLHPAANGI